MEVICENCETKLNIPDEKIPKDRAVNIACPKCKHKINVDARSPEPESPEPAVEQETEAAPPKAAPPHEVEDEDEALGFIEEGVKLAMALASDPGEAEKLRQTIEELGYKYVSAGNTRKAVGKMRLHHFDVVIVSDMFDGVPLGQSPIVQYMNHIAMSIRRRIFFALIGDEFKTMDDMVAFAMSVNLVINRQDLDNLTAILKRGIADNERFYKVFMDTLVETGKA